MKNKYLVLLLFCCFMATAKTVKPSNAKAVAYTAIPDSNFENVLNTYDDTPYDHQVPTSNIVGINTLTIVGANISDLTGIQDFAALKTLYCGINQLTTLDLSKNAALTSLYCSANQLTALDVSKNTALKYLYCDTNQLTTLDLNANTALLHLSCYKNQLTALDVSKNSALEDLYCYQNQLTALDVSKNTVLKTLYCDQNQLQNLNIKNGSNSRLNNFVGTNNPYLTCIQADSETAPIGQYWVKDDTAYYSTNCYLANPALEKYENGVSAYPNPTDDTVNIIVPSDAELIKTDVYSLMGQKVGTSTQSFVSLKDLSRGEYFLVIETNAGRLTKKVIKR